MCVVGRKTADDEESARVRVRARLCRRPDLVKSEALTASPSRVVIEEEGNGVGRAKGNEQRATTSLPPWALAWVRGREGKQAGQASRAGGDRGHRGGEARKRPARDLEVRIAAGHLATGHGQKVRRLRVSLGFAESARVELESRRGSFQVQIRPVLMREGGLCTAKCV